MLNLEVYPFRSEEHGT